MKEHDGPAFSDFSIYGNTFSTGARGYAVYLLVANDDVSITTTVVCGDDAKLMLFDSKTAAEDYVKDVILKQGYMTIVGYEIRWVQAVRIEE